MTDTTPAAEIAALSRSADFLAGNPAAVARMFALHEAAQQGGFPAPGESAPAEPAPSSPAAPDAPGGRFRPEDYTLEMTLDAKASPESVVSAQAAAREMAAALDVEPDLARGGSAIIDAAIAARGGKAMDGVELNRMEALLQRQLGADYDAVLARAEARLKAAGAHGETMRRIIVAAGPEAAAWSIASLGAPR
jgi:hypothetical protein